MNGFRARRACLATLAALTVSALPAVAADPEAVQVRGSAAFAPCLAPALEAFTRVSRVPAALTIAEPDPPLGADVVVGDDTEMTRLLEGGIADLTGAFDLGEVPWVTVAPPGSAAGALAAGAGETVAVLGGKAGQEARVALGASSSRPGRVDVTDDAAVLRAAAHAWVPRTLAGDGKGRPAAVRPLVATVAAISASSRPAAARRLLAFLASEAGRGALRGCFDPVGTSSPDGTVPSGPAARAASPALQTRAAPYAERIMDWWLPQCSLSRNRYNDPEEVLGPPDARSLGGAESFQGFMSLGQAGFVTVDMGTTVVDGDGPEIRVFQTTTGEPVTLYGSVAAEGPFVLLGLRVPCGVRSGGTFSNHCDFDLRDGGLAAARYFRVEDGEIYPCLAGGTVTEGADIDAVEILSR